MPYFVLLVLHEIERTDEIISAWEEAGVSGITVMASTGLGRISNKKIALREDLPLIPSLNDLLSEHHEELLNRTMFSLVEDDALVDRIVQATERVLGSLSQPHTGILAIMPVARVYGLNKVHTRNKSRPGR